MNQALLKAWNWTKTTVDNSIGVLLTAMFVVVLFLVISILAALQFHDSIKAGPADINSGDLRQTIATMEWRQSVQDEHDKLTDERRAINDKMFSLMQDVYTSVGIAIQDFTDPQLGTIRFPVAGDPNANQIGKVREAYANYRALALAAINGNGDPKYRSFAKAKLGQITGDVNTRLAEYDALVKDDASHYFKINNAEATLASIDRGLDKHFAEHPKLRDECEELLTYKSIFRRLAYDMIFAPKSSLTLLLAVVMGLLGSLIYLARERVIDQAPVGLSVIIFRASLGGALAVAIYVFAAAGMMAVGPHASGSDAAEMSPYLISFIGITAGYLSEHMAAWMAQLGRDTFKVNGVESKERWAPHLAQQLDSKTSATIAQALNVPQAQVDSWIAVSAAVPSEYQALLAVHLGLDISDVFTDIPPMTHRQV